MKSVKQYLQSRKEKKENKRIRRLEDSQNRLFKELILIRSEIVTLISSVRSLFYYLMGQNPEEEELIKNNKESSNVSLPNPSKDYIK